MCGIFVKTFFSYSNPIYCSICKLKNVSFDKNEFKTIYITEGFNLLIFLTQILLLISAKSFIKSRKVTVFEMISVLSLFIEAKMEEPQLSLEDIKEIFVLFPSPAYSLPPTSSFLAFQSSYFSFSTSWRSLSRSAFTSSSSTTSSSTFSRTSSSPSSSSEGLTLGCRSCSAQTRGQGRGERSSMWGGRTSPPGDQLSSCHSFHTSCRSCSAQTRGQGRGEMSSMRGGRTSPPGTPGPGRDTSRSWNTAPYEERNCTAPQ